MKQDAVKLEFVVALCNVFLFIGLVPDNKKLCIGPCHAFKGLSRVKLVEYPAIAVGRGHDTALKGKKLL